MTKRVHHAIIYVIIFHISVVCKLEYRVTGDSSEETSGYGIALFCRGELQKHLPCISENRADIDALAAMLNELGVEACHFEDVVEDYLTDFSVGR